MSQSEENQGDYLLQDIYLQEMHGWLDLYFSCEALRFAISLASLGVC